MAHNSRQINLSTKAAEQLRLNLLRVMDIEHFSLKDSTQEIIGFLLESYLKYRGCLSEGYSSKAIRAHLKCNPTAGRSLYESVNIDFNSIGYLIDYVFQNQLANHSDDSSGEQSKRKAHGAFYTPFPIADYIVRNTVRLDKKDFKVLDPACGSGVFLSATALYLSENQFSNKEILSILRGWDKNGEALKISQLLLAAELGLSEIELLDLMSSGNFVQKDTLLESLNTTDLFNRSSFSPERYDYIVANPPYDRLKPDNLGESAKAEMAKYVAAIKDSGDYPLSATGSLELYRLFMEKILELMNSSNGRAGLIVPMSFTNDKSAKALREKIILNKQLRKMLFIPEKAKAFDGVSQAFCILIMEQNSSDKFDSATCLDSKKLDKISFRASSTNRLKAAFPNELNLIDIPERAYELVSHLNSFPSIKNSKTIKNRRGEFDLSFNKDLLGVGEPRLLRGRNLSEYKLKEYDLVDYKNYMKRIDGTPKHQDVLSYRIACQQIANMDSKKRLKFALVEPEVILGNSLNYLLISSASRQQLIGLLAIMNSYLMDWRFRMTSSNNHVNNYEIDELPMPKDLRSLSVLGALVESNLSKLHDHSFRKFLEMKVLELYGAENFADIVSPELAVGEIIYSELPESRTQYYQEAIYA